MGRRVRNGLAAKQGGDLGLGGLEVVADVDYWEGCELSGRPCLGPPILGFKMG